MDIAALSVINSQNNVQQSVGIAMLKQSMNVASEQGAALQQMISSTPSVDPNLGQNIDISV